MIYKSFSWQATFFESAPILSISLCFPSRCLFTLVNFISSRLLVYSSRSSSLLKMIVPLLNFILSLLFSNSLFDMCNVRHLDRRFTHFIQVNIFRSPRRSICFLFIYFTSEYAYHCFPSILEPLGPSNQTRLRRMNPLNLNLTFAIVYKTPLKRWEYKGNHCHPFYPPIPRWYLRQHSSSRHEQHLIIVTQLWVGDLCWVAPRLVFVQTKFRPFPSSEWIQGSYGGSFDKHIEPKK